jgi:hypothetical protein
MGDEEQENADIGYGRLTQDGMGARQKIEAKVRGRTDNDNSGKPCEGFGKRTRIRY